MGRPGAGGGSIHKSSGSMHRVSGSSGSMHRVSTSSRPTISRPAGRPSSEIKTQSSRSLVSQRTQSASRPMNNSASKPKPAIKHNSRPSMNYGSSMLGGYGNADGYSEESRIRQKIEQDAREREMERDREQRERRREIDDRLRREREDMMVEAAVRSAVNSSGTNYRSHQAGNTTVINNTYVNNYDRADSSTNVDEPIRSRSYSSGSGIVAPVRESINTESDNHSNKNVRKVLIIFASVMIVIAIILAFVLSSKSDSTTVNRSKLDTGMAYINDCVVDELGWLNTSKVSKGLKQFYNDTGAQPYIWIRAYDGTDYSDDEEMSIATDYFDNTIGRQDVVLFVYFEESNPDEVGNMALIHGTQSGTIMDSEAEDIFWNYLDDAWYTYSEDETDEMFIHIFEKTGKSIMYHSTTVYDVLSGLMIVLTIIAIASAVIVMLREINRRNKEKAEETERILNTSLESLAEEKKDDLLEKYK